MAKFNTAQTIASMIATADSVNESLENEMTELVGEFGESPLLPTKQGGLNGNAFREGSKLETQQADADRIGLSLEKAQSLAAIRAALNAHRPTLYQTYQIAYFGLEQIKPTKPPAEPSDTDLEITALVADSKAIMANKKEVSADLKVAKAQLTLAKAQGDKGAEIAAQAEVTALEYDRDLLKQDLASKKHDLDHCRNEKKSAPLYDQCVALKEKLIKSKLLDGWNDPTGMSLDEIIGILAPVSLDEVS
jgi:hypothetical protein